MADKKPVIILLMLCAVLLTVLLVDKEEVDFDSGSSDQVFLPDLNELLPTVARIELDSQSQKVVLERLEDNWNVASKDNYPADSGSIRKLLYGIAGLTIVEMKTDDESLYEKIGLKQGSEQALRVTMMDANNNVVSDLLFGNSVAALSNQGQDWFVREIDKDRSWQVNGQLSLNRQAHHWLNKPVLNIDIEDIDKVILNANQQEPVVLQASDEPGLFELVGIKESQQVEDYTINEIIESARLIELDDVRKQSVSDESGHGPSVELLTKNALKIMISVTDAEQGWVRLLADTQSDDSSVIQRSQAFNEQWSNWSYKIPMHQLDHLLQKRQDLILESESS